MELVRLVYGLMCRNDSCMYGCKVAFLMYILIPFCRKCGWLCIFHEEFCEKDKFAYHIVDILRNLLFFMVYLLWTVFPEVSDLVSFPTLTGDLGMWRKHLLKAAEKDTSFKHKLASALLVAAHSTGEPHTLTQSRPP